MIMKSKLIRNIKNETNLTKMLQKTNKSITKNK